jgi:hypothetical protein
MNQRVTAPTTAGRRRVWPSITLLLSALALEIAQTTAPTLLAKERFSPGPGTGESLPYLCFVGPPPLRFQEAVSQPDPGGRPLGGMPPGIGVKTEAETTRTLAPVLPAVASSAIATAGKQEAEDTGKPPALVAAPPGPPSILPDDAGPKARPEDFLPFFQFPGAKAHGSDPVAVPPAPGTLPPSTATYEQQ